MSNFFNIRRFCKYLTYDLNNAWNNFGFSLLVMGMVPLIVFLFNQIFSLAFTQTLVDFPMWVKGTALSATLIALIIIAPTKLYGHLTTRRAGSDWLMIPASAFEKFLSMVLILCVVLPVAFFAVFSACDLLMSFVPYYGESAVMRGADVFNTILGEIDPEVAEITVAGYSLIWLSFCCNILMFALGAICFKKSKGAKVILCIIALECLLSLLGTLFFTTFDIDFESFFENMTAQKAQNLLNAVLNIVYFVIFGVLLGGIYARIKTIKH